MNMRRRRDFYVIRNMRMEVAGGVYTDMTNIVGVYNNYEYEEAAGF